MACDQYYDFWVEFKMVDEFSEQTSVMISGDS